MGGILSGETKTSSQLSLIKIILILIKILRKSNYGIAAPKIRSVLGIVLYYVINESYFHYCIIVMTSLDVLYVNAEQEM